MLGIQKYIQLEIKIEDNGVGISTENLSKLFKDFSKLEDHENINPNGTGLGLSICKNLVHQMGGAVTVES
jgi:signal transduction histidine kinase